MYMLPFMALVVIGAVVAWRQNPMYTFGRTVRFLLVVGLAITAFVFAISGVLHWTAGKSQAVQLTSIFTVVGVATLAMIGLIIEVSTPSSVALPKSAKLVRFHRAKVDAWAKLAGWTLLGLAVLALVLPTTGKIILGVLGGLLAFLSIVMVFAGYISARKMDQWLTEVELRPWVYWTYTAEQWAAWNAFRVRQVEATPPTFTWRKSWWKLGLAVVGITAGVALFSPGGWVFKAAYLGGVDGLLIGLAGWSVRSQKGNGARAAAKLKAVAPEVYFGSEGLFADGAFWPWVSVGIYLLTAAPGQGAPAHLDFQFVKIEGGSQSTIVNQGVLLPVGAEPDVARLQQELTAACPQAQIDLV